MTIADSNWDSGSHRRLGSWRNLVLALASTSAFGLAAGSGCSQSETKAECEGFVIEGRCEAACDDSKCAPNHKCVANDCRPACVTDADCPPSYNCLLAISGDGTQATFCLQHGYSGDGSTGQYVPCATSDECDTRRGFSCQNGECRIWGCATHDDCLGVGSCESDGPGQPRYCKVDDNRYGPGQFSTRCPLTTECDTASGFFCRGAGEGDASAYCTAPCATDGECAPGYFCTNRRTGFPCEDTLCPGLPGDSTDPTCTTREAFDAPGSGWSCGPFALMRSTCVKRSFCVPCETESDCAALPNQVCAKDTSGAKSCTVICDEAAPIGACPGGTSAFCGVHDQEFGQPTCAPRYGSCVGEGEQCSPCLVDEDCGAAGICLSIPTSGERFCIDTAFACTDAGGTDDCPDSPGKIKMVCLGADEMLSPGDFLFNKCYPPDVDTGLQSYKASCWPK